MASIGDVLSDLELRALQVKLNEHIRTLQRTGVTGEEGGRERKNRREGGKEGGRGRERERGLPTIYIVTYFQTWTSRS